MPMNGFSTKVCDVKYTDNVFSGRKIDTMSTIFEHALELARAKPVQNPAVYLPTHKRKINRRGILWLGQTCNLRCHFCYFLDRITDDSHPEHGFMSLDKAKSICKTLVDYYGNNSIDIQGGEPTLYPPIYDLVAYCAEIGLSPTLITNAIALSKFDNAVRYKDAGIRDFLISVQGLGDVYDRIVGRPGGHVWQMKALDNLQNAGIPFRFNTVLSKLALPQLIDISKLAVETGAGTVNFLGFNPFNDQTTGKRSSENVPSYMEIRGSRWKSRSITLWIRAWKSMSGICRSAWCPTVIAIPLTASSNCLMICTRTTMPVGRGLTSLHNGQPGWSSRRRSSSASVSNWDHCEVRCGP